MLSVAFDATILTCVYEKNASRSGIFFASFNIFEQLKKRQDVKVVLYADPRVYLEFKRFLQDFCPQNESLYKRECPRVYMWFYNVFFEMHSFLFKRKFLRKPFALLLLISRYLIKIRTSLMIDYEKISACDLFFSPVHGIPQKVRMQKVQKYVMLYDAIPLKFPEYYPSGSFLDFIKKTGQNDDLFFFDSKSAFDDFKSFFSFISDCNSCVIQLAAGNQFYPQRDENLTFRLKAKYKIPQGKKFIFSLCTLEPRKNLIRAVKNFICFVERNKIENLIWVMGGGHWDSFMKRFDREVGRIEGFNNLVVPAGYIDDEDLPALYSSAEWFVYTSQYEGFGLPPLEAMQCGCPVITSNNSSLPEVVGDAGIMIDWDSDEQHVAAYEKYYFNENLRKENSRKGLERAKLFSWEKTVDQILLFMKQKCSSVQ